MYFRSINQVCMFEVFLAYINSKTKITDEEAEMIKAVSVIKKLRKKQYLLQEGDVWRYNAFICKGFLRTYQIDDKGHEHIMNFAPENYWTGDRESLQNETPSPFNIDAIEETHVLLINKQDFDNLCKKIPAFNDMVNTILQRSFNASQRRIHAAISYSAEEKYQHFLDTFPHIVNRIPQHMIASYLGLSPETLSRVRTQAAKK